MENKRSLWSEAFKYGTVVGLVSILFEVLGMAFMNEDGRSPWIIGFLSLVTFIALVYLFTKRFVAATAGRKGCSYGRCVGFVAAMMVFAGILVGLYSYVAANFIDHDFYAGLVEKQLVLVENMYSADQFEMMEKLTYAMAFNPIVLVLGSVFGMCLKGVVVGLITSALVYRKPDPFMDMSESDGEAR